MRPTVTREASVDWTRDFLVKAWNKTFKEEQLAHGQRPAFGTNNDARQRLIRYMEVRSRAPERAKLIPELVNMMQEHNQRCRMECRHWALINPNSLRPMAEARRETR